MRRGGRTAAVPLDRRDLGVLVLLLLPVKVTFVVALMVPLLSKLLKLLTVRPPAFTLIVPALT